MGKWWAVEQEKRVGREASLLLLLDPPPPAGGSKNPRSTHVLWWASRQFYSTVLYKNVPNKCGGGTREQPVQPRGGRGYSHRRVLSLKHRHTRHTASPCNEIAMPPTPIRGKIRLCRRVPSRQRHCSTGKVN